MRINIVNRYSLLSNKDQDNTRRRKNYRSFNKTMCDISHHIISHSGNVKEINFSISNLSLITHRKTLGHIDFNLSLTLCSSR